MKKNIGLADRTIRMILAVTFAALYFTGTISGTTGIVLMVLAIVFLGTSFISFCPIYWTFGLNSRTTKEHAKS